MTKATPILKLKLELLARISNKEHKMAMTQQNQALSQVMPRKVPVLAQALAIQLASTTEMQQMVLTYNSYRFKT
ncbi:MAG: hypothetical protein M3243_05000 [Thermoproteota archaeon]|nr:hypothetical protein [Thermoproteota archaeon]